MKTWFCRIKAETHDWSGKRRRLDRKLPSGKLKETIFQVFDKIERPWEFYGVELHLFTPIHHNVFIIDPDTGEVENIS